MFRRRIGRRIVPGAVFFLLIWPVATAISATIDLKAQPATARLPWGATFALLLQAEARMASEFLFVALFLTLTCAAFFALLSRSIESDSRARVWLEPAVFACSILAGIALEYPAVLTNPLLIGLRPVPILAGMLLVTALPLLLALLLGLRAGGARTGAAWTGGAAILVILAWSAARVPALRHPRTSPSGSVVVLGIDSLSQADDLSALRDFARAKGGAWYSRAVSPGLLTNPVWAAVVQHRPVRETGIWEVFMTTDWAHVPFDLVREAHRKGFETFSFFSDQFTTYVGSEAGFDVNRSGPMGWLQLGTATLKNDSVFLSVALPRLPRLPGARLPRNQSGTFGFDVPMELEELLTADAKGRPAFVAGHLDYLHQPLYPRMSDLTPAERSLVWGSPVESAQDFSVDWQYPEIPGDRLGLYRWKIARVQKMVRDAIVRTGFLDAGKHGRLALFSDHGNRKGLTEENFVAPKYWNVMFSTFGAAARDTQSPISLLDVPEMLGFPDTERPGPAPAAVQFAGINPEESARLNQAFVLPDGRIIADPRVMGGIGRRIREFRPYPAPGTLVPASAP
jgi:hypothetical protein